MNEDHIEAGEAMDKLIASFVFGQHLWEIPGIEPGTVHPLPYSTEMQFAWMVVSAIGGSCFMLAGPGTDQDGALCDPAADPPDVQWYARFCGPESRGGEAMLHEGYAPSAELAICRAALSAKLPRL